MSSIRGGRLRLKGDREKPQKRKRDAEDERARRTPQQASTAQADEEGWVEAESVADLSGPLLLLSSDNKNSIITAEPLRIVVCAEGGQMSCPVTTELDLPAAAALLEPTDVSQVLLGQSLVPGKYSLKSAFGKYVTCDLLGHVAASKDAVGPAEEWKFTRTEHGFVFENVHGALLALEPTLNRVFCVPKDSTAAPSSTFHVRCQAGRKHSADQSTASGEPVCNLQTIETEEARKFLSWGAGRSRTKQMPAQELLSAQKAGRLHEALLEKRVKLKHDPFC